MSEVVECPYSVSMGNVTPLIRGCRAGGMCGRTGWSGSYKSCKWFKDQEREKEKGLLRKP